MSNMVTLRPGARGTLNLVKKYGSQLLYVRYRYDETAQTRVKTIELVIDEKPWRPLARSPEDVLVDKAW